MALFIPKEFKSRLDEVTPFTGGVRAEAEAMFDNRDVEDRAVTIYQILAMLVAEGRLDGTNLRGDVCCLDVGAPPVEAAVFKGLRSNSVVLADKGHDFSHRVKNIPDTSFILGDPVQALSRLKPNSLDLVTMMNAYSDTLQSVGKRAELVDSVAQSLRVGGNFVLTCDSLNWTNLQKLADEIGRGRTNPHLAVTLPGNRFKPMDARGWVLRSILIENTLGFDFDQGSRFLDRDYDGCILVAQKIE